MNAPDRRDALAYAAIATLVSAALLPEVRVLGTLGARFGQGLYSALGGAAWAVPVWFADEAYSAWIGRPGAAWRRVRRAGGALLAVVGLGLGGLGGRLGDRLGDILQGAIGLGAYLLVLLAFVWFVRGMLGREGVERVAARAAHIQHRLAVAWSRTNAQLERSRIARAIDATADMIVIDTTERPRAVPPPLPRRGIGQPARVVELEAPHRRLRSYKLPNVCVLAEPEPRVRASDKDELKRTARQVELTLYAHGVSASITASTRGPVIDLFEAAPVPGQPLAPIKKLGPELELQHAGLRIVPMPGTGGVGIEIPRPERDRAPIALREILESDAWRRSTAALPLALGLSSVGETVIADLATAPHLLVAGATGSGKSVGLNVMLTSLLLSRSPRELRLALIDPKVVEFSRYRDLPHLLAPPATETEDAIALLEWMCSEMDRRYSVFAARGVTDIISFNALGGESLPRVVLVVDEYADLSSVARKDVEGPITRIAQKARAAGMHVILATQRPSVDVITGIIKANFPSRIAFKVSQRVDSQTILDRAGAERLVGRGDSLCLLPARGTDLQRVHGAYVSSDDVRIVCDAWRAQARPQYLDLVGLDDGDDERDKLEHAAAAPAPRAHDRALEAAIEYAREHGTVSTGKLRKELGISFERAAELMSRMDLAGLLVDGPNRTRCYREPSTALTD
jgi:S-DNA-T family DNA segregation ATPase FtsK/SpoIIIE